MLNITNLLEKWKSKPQWSTTSHKSEWFINKKPANSKCQRSCGEKGNCICCWECELVQSLWKKVCRYLYKLEMELPYYPAIPLLDIYMEKMKTLIWKDTCTSMFIAVLFIIAKTCKQPKCPSTDDWIKICHLYNRMLLSHK